MKLKKLKIQNFRSFGNNINELIFDNEKGNLILISAPNGSGKSTIKFCMDFALYGEVKNNSKKIKLASLPNRFNNNLMVELDFESKNSDIKIIRKINPSLFEVYINDELVKRAGKSNVQDKLQEYNDFDIDTWNSFISMSINDFKNFMSLKPEEKRLLLDRLFNLELINDISKILKEKKKQYKFQIDLFDAEINSYENSLNEFKSSIEKLKDLSKQNHEKEKDELKNILSSKKEEYKSLQEKLTKYSQKETEIENKIKEIIETGSTVKNELKTTKEKIELFNSGICPTCGSDLTTNVFESYKKELLLKIKELEKVKTQLQTEYSEINIKQEKLKKVNTNTKNSFSELKYYLKDIKEKIDSIENKKEEDYLDINTLNNLNDSIKNIENKKEESLIKIEDVKSEESIYDQMIKMFSNDGIKKSIISKIIVPINHYIKENLEELGMNFNIKLDDEFNAHIETFGEEIEVETLSTGEAKKANLAIIVAYLKLIRMKRYINILFLDEVFSSVDIDGIYQILTMLRNFAYEYKINIFLIHHAMLEKSYFDKVIKIEKNITSNILEE